MQYTAWTTALGAIALLSACSPAGDSAAPPPAAPPAPPPAAAAEDTGGLPAVIVAERGGFIPEGVEYDAGRARFLTGSLSEGTIFEIGLDGSVTPFITDPMLVSSVGIEADEPRDRLLVANSDFSIFQGNGSGQAMMGVFSLTTGERIAMVDMAATRADAGGVFFTNDVTVADDGTIYATDTRQNVIYSVNGDYEAAVFYAFPAIENLALNGIVYHEDGYLITADLGNGALYRTPLDNPAATAMISLSEPVPGVDGLVWRADGALAVVENAAEGGRVVALVSADDWQSATVDGVAPHAGQATTAAAVGEAIYSVQPHFNDPAAPSLHRADFQ